MILLLGHRAGKGLPLIEAARLQLRIHCAKQARLQEHLQVLNVRRKQEQIGNRGLWRQLADVRGGLRAHVVDHALTVRSRGVRHVAVPDVQQGAHGVLKGAIRHPLHRLLIQKPLGERTDARTCVGDTWLWHSPSSQSVE